MTWRRFKVLLFGMSQGSAWRNQWRHDNDPENKVITDPDEMEQAFENW